MYEFYKKCEESLKRRIIINYGQYLSEKQKESFNNKDYITDEVMSIKKLNDVFDYLLNKMLNDLIDVKCSQITQIDEDNDLSVPCGKTLKNALINYYKLNIANTINFKPTINYNYALDIDLLNYINQESDNIVDKNIFNKNAIELSKIDELSLYVKNTISQDIQEYISSLNNIEEVIL